MKISAGRDDKNVKNQKIGQKMETREVLNQKKSRKCWKKEKMTLLSVEKMKKM